MPLYHCSHLELIPGHLIQPGNWGKRILETGPTHKSWNREMTLEQIRIQFYPTKPSRLYSCFGCYTLDAMNFYRKHLMPHGIIYEIEIVDELAAVHSGDFNAVEPLPGHPANMVEIAHLYWEYKLKTEIEGYEGIQFTEFVTSSPIRVVKRMD